ncbi:hypothetical protein OG225_35945 [Nocardia sp. NBC_01377]
MKRYADADQPIPLRKKARARIPFYLRLWWDRLRGPAYVHRRATRNQP